MVVVAVRARAVTRCDCVRAGVFVFGAAATRDTLLVVAARAVTDFSAEFRDFLPPPVAVAARDTTPELSRVVATRDDTVVVRGVMFFALRDVVVFACVRAFCSDGIARLIFVPSRTVTAPACVDTPNVNKIITHLDMYVSYMFFNTPLYMTL